MDFYVLPDTSCMRHMTARIFKYKKCIGTFCFAHNAVILLMSIAAAVP